MQRRNWKRVFGSVGQAALLACLLVAGWMFAPQLWASGISDQGWELLVVAYPDGRDVSVTLGGGARTLTAKGLCTVKWRNKIATVELEISNLPAPADAGWPGEQYVLWAADKEKHVTNLGLVPLNGKHAKWKLQLPARIFGLLVTAEKNPQATAPSPDVALESLLPTDPDLVLPVFRVEVPLAR
jgi:hypothetical protein